jgi:hypothetical protein
MIALALILWAELGLLGALCLGRVVGEADRACA